MWKQSDNPFRLERRFEFDNYQNTSNFMKEIDSLCKANKIYPNISFGSKFVSVTIFLGSKIISLEENEFKSKIDKRFNSINRLN
tara:strand:+ start:508 stop:759 length:252 start_codon:yes stop_codon:yes gene_type:complete